MPTIEISQEALEVIEETKGAAGADNYSDVIISMDDHIGVLTYRYMGLKAKFDALQSKLKTEDNPRRE